MLKLNVRTKHKPDEVVKRALEFFGPGGYGLKVAEQSDTCAYFEGVGGESRLLLALTKKEPR